MLGFYETFSRKFVSSAQGGARQGETAPRELQILQTASENSETKSRKSPTGRKLISDLVGINVPYGFDTAADPAETSTWSRLGPAERDKQQKEFDPACGIHR
ncbi:MAG: hypothetical protein ABSH34_32150, partial [Verrucomicrobiota bacterium]